MSDHTDNRWNPASDVIDALGGPTSVAKYLNIHRVTVSRWAMPLGKAEGKGGEIHRKYWDQLIEMARKKRKRRRVSYAVFLQKPSPAPPRSEAQVDDDEDELHEFAA